MSIRFFLIPERPKTLRYFLDNTSEALRADSFELSELGPALAKGRAEKLELFDVLGLDSETPPGVRWNELPRG